MANQRLKNLLSLGMLLSLSCLLTIWAISTFFFLFSEIYQPRAQAAGQDERERGRYEARIEQLEAELKSVKDLKVDLSIALITRDISDLKNSLTVLKEEAKTNKENNQANQKYLITTLAGVLMIALRAIYMLMAAVIKQGRAYLARNQSVKEET